VKILSLQPFAMKMAVAQIFVELGNGLKSDQILHLPLCTMSSTARTHVFSLEIESIYAQRFLLPYDTKFGTYQVAAMDGRCIGHI
jgi:hypothetical protein